MERKNGRKAQSEGRPDGRQADQLRRYRINRFFQKHPAGSVLIEMGNTKVICAATIEERVPNFLRGTGEGWLTAEYSLLPSATNTRTPREATRGRQTGRTQEIQRLIGRALRAVTDMEALGERQIIIDCDVIQADGGTRCASITGGYVALWLACKKLVDQGVLKKIPLTGQVAAVSAGIWNDEPILDLAYEEDSHAIVDANFVMTEKGEFVEIQGTGEGRPFSKEELNKLMSLARRGTAKLCREQRKITGEIG